MGTLVLLPGMDGSDVMFRPLVETKPVGVDVVTVAYPPGPANTYQDLLPLVQQALPRDRPFFLLGWSFSGPLALMAAAVKPPRLRGLVLASSFATRPLPYVPRWVRHLVRPFLFKLAPAVLRAKVLLGAHVTPALMALVAEAQSCAGAVALACRARAALAVDATRELAACAVPVLYLRASADRVIRRSRADQIRRALPTVEVVDIAGPHLAIVTNPTASWSALQRFMDSCAHSKS